MEVYIIYQNCSKSRKKYQQNSDTEAIIQRIYFMYPTQLCKCNIVNTATSCHPYRQIMGQSSTPISMLNGLCHYSWEGAS